MRNQIESIKQEFLAKIADVSNMEEIEKLRVEFLGKKGAFTQVLRSMGALTPEERPLDGQARE